MSTVRIREATLSDTDGMARVRIDTWRSAYRGILPEDYLAGLSYDQTASRWRETLWKALRPGSFVYIAEDEAGQIIGIAIGGPEQSADLQYRGEIYVLYVLPEYQRQAIGRRLVTACALRLLQNGLDSLLIWVIAANPYRRFYETLGGKVVRYKEKEIGGITVPEVGYGWQDIRCLVGEYAIR
jgi:ribosomal protein S18 acetylase RimI-like enzyme